VERVVDGGVASLVEEVLGVVCVHILATPKRGSLIVLQVPIVIVVSLAVQNLVEEDGILTLLHVEGNLGIDLGN